MRSTHKRWFEILLLTSFLGVIGIIYYKNVSKLGKMKSLLGAHQYEFKKIKDSADVIKFANYYLNSLFDISFTENNKSHNLQNVKLYTLENGKPEFKQLLKPILLQGKKKLVIRYTEIGCNSCSDSTIQSIKKNQALRNSFDIIFMVDFSNYDAYLKWRKIAEISDPVYWVEKGGLPFTLEKANESYIYTIDEFSRPSNFFIPNSRLPYYINAYLQHICQEM